LRYLPITESQGPAGARNMGWRAARAPLIAFTDDDTLPSSNWLEAGLEAMEPDVHALAGRIIMPLPNKPTDYERDAGGLQHAAFVTANCFVRRSALEEIGGFDERYSEAWREDSDLQFSLLKKNRCIRKADKAIVIHPLRPATFAAGLSMQRKVMFDALLRRKHRDYYRRYIRKRLPWFYAAATGSLAAAVLLLAAGKPALSGLAMVAWLALSIGLFF